MLAYADPWSSPVGYQLDPVQREPICAALNSAILGNVNTCSLIGSFALVCSLTRTHFTETHGLPKQPPLELVIGQTQECVRQMSHSSIGSCAFASLSDFIQ